MKNAIKAAAPGLALVAAAMLAAPALAAAAQMPPEQHQGPVGYVSGGVGKAEARLFERTMGQHRLAIELLQHAGKAEEFTANAQVRIADVHGRTVLDTKAAGPFVLVDLAPGRYSILATLNGHELQKSAVQVPRTGMARATFEFPAHTDG